MTIAQNIDVTNLAPACYGAVSCFARDSVHCQQCVAYSACEQQSVHTLHQIKNIINVDDLIREHEKARASTKAKRDKMRDEMNEGRKQVNYGIKPNMPEVVERATKVEKVVFEVTAEDELLISKMPVKVQPYAINMLKRGLFHDVRKGLSQNKNAAKGIKPEWFEKAVELLNTGGFTRAELKAYFMRELKWNENSAAGHVSLSIVLLTKFGMAVSKREESSERFVVDPKLYAV